jgi:hypothetical protein
MYTKFIRENKRIIRFIAFNYLFFNRDVYKLYIYLGRNRVRGAKSLPFCR